MTGRIKLYGGVGEESGALLRASVMAAPEMVLLGMAGDGLSVVEGVSVVAPDLLILDLHLPQLDGLGVLEQLAWLRRSLRPAVIVLAAGCGHEVLHRLRRAGADQVLQKPVTPEMLSHHIRRLAGSGSGVPEPTRAETCATASLPDLESETGRLLSAVGIPPSLKGHHYLRYAIGLVVARIDLLSAVTKEIYPLTAAHFNTKPFSVDRAMRHAIGRAWQQGGSDVRQHLFGHILKTGHKPTNSLFLAVLADALRNRSPLSQGCSEDQPPI